MTREIWARRRLAVLAVAAVAVALLLQMSRYARQPDTTTLSIVAHSFAAPPGTDSTLYMQMGENAFRSDHEIYRKLFFTEHEKFIYPPSSLFLMEGLDWLKGGPLPEDALWKALLLAGWIGCVLTGAFFYRSQRQAAKPWELAAVGVLGVLFLPFAEALYRGQVQVFLTFLWGVSLLLWTQGRKGWAGFVVALTCMFKPQLAVFLLWGMVRREWRFTAVFAGTAAMLLGCSVARFGVQNHLDYVTVLSYLSRHGEALRANQSMNGLMNRLLENGDAIGWRPTVYPPYRAAVYVASTCFALLCLLAGLVIPRVFKWERTTSDLLLFGCLSVLMSPITWEHHYGYFFFALALLLARAEKLERWRWWMIAACFLTMANRWPPLDHQLAGIRSLLGDYLFFAAIALCVLLCVRSVRSGTPVET